MPASLPLPLFFFFLFNMEKLYPKELGRAGACSFKNDSYLTLPLGSSPEQRVLAGVLHGWPLVISIASCKVQMLYASSHGLTVACS
jgi:hypothetical protein